ncbi:ribonuclease H-like domain-containing protein [Thiorhodococcus fuscus]|uniref:Ribonuclease H-like domain-containing protein n=1 Tax=Thiorhodococcus fuscus TaxID=527200 RepID=A0ABW4Y7D4_9GAMM
MADRSLAGRLGRLRGQTKGASVGVDDSPTASGNVDPAPLVRAGTVAQVSFADRVQRLMGAPSVRLPREPDESALAESIGAERIAPGVLRLDRLLDGRTRHGSAPLSCFVLDPDPGLQRPLVEMCSRPECVDGEGLRWPAVFLDTETSGLAGGTGTWAFMTGVLRQDGAGWRLRQYLLARLDAEPVYLEAVRDELADAGTLVTYNGRSFDGPLLSTRFRLAGFPDPLRDLHHLDLLGPVRRAFGRVWPNCRLATAETRLLRFVREGDLPGSEAPAAWLGWLRQGEIAPLSRVLRHNRWDLLSLAGLMPVLARSFEDPAALGADTHAVARFHRSKGRESMALRLLEFERGRLGPEALLDLARLYRRQGDWESALRLWESLTASGDPQARLALAKYHEHRTRDVALALELANGLPPGADRERRCDRLRGKLTEVGEDADRDIEGDRRLSAD